MFRLTQITRNPNGRCPDGTGLLCVVVIVVIAGLAILPRAQASPAQASGDRQIPLPSSWQKGFVTGATGSRIEGMFWGDLGNREAWRHWTWTSKTGFQAGDAVPTQGFWQRTWSPQAAQTHVKTWNKQHGWEHTGGDQAELPPRPLMSHTAFTCTCYSISADGRVAIGDYEVDGGPRHDHDSRGIETVNGQDLTVDTHLFLWTAQGGFRDLLDAVPGLSSYEENADGGVVSEDGRTLVGVTDKLSIWVVDIPASILAARSEATPAASGRTNRLTITGEVVSIRTGHLEMLVITVQQADGTTVTLPAARRKAVLIPRGVVVEAAVKAGVTITVTGNDRGPGALLTAASIAVQPAGK